MSDLAIYDMDRTVTKRPTYTRFLLHCAMRRAPWRLLFLPLALLSMTAYGLRIIDRARLKEINHQLLIGGQAGQYGQVNYAAAKSGIHGFTKALAQEGARFGVTVNAIAPGYIDTDMVAAVPEDVLAKIVARIPVGRLGKADEIARGVAFLCDENAGFVTGSTLSINGGQHMY
jgi:NAD(P)-dependent dehydrogenase (short-subunit alcohol dehydrogenase family)